MKLHEKKVIFWKKNCSLYEKKSVCTIYTFIEKGLSWKKSIIMRKCIWAREMKCENVMLQKVLVCDKVLGREMYCGKKVWGRKYIMRKSFVRDIWCAEKKVLVQKVLLCRKYVVWKRGTVQADHIFNVR